MRRGKFLPLAVFVAITAVTHIATPAATGDGEAAFNLREQTMKRMGRALYTTIGRVVRGKAELGPDALAAAEEIATSAKTLGSVFPPGSDVPDSRIKPQIFTAETKVDGLVRAVQEAAEGLVPSLKRGDKAGLAAAYKTVDDACEACHREFRKPAE